MAGVSTYSIGVFAAIANGEPAPPKWAGLKFFNVYGPNEYHKGAMRSAIAVNYANIVAGIRRLRSYRSDYPDGGQMRDFVYVADCAAIALWMLIILSHQCLQRRQRKGAHLARLDEGHVQGGWHPGSRSNSLICRKA